MTPLQKLIDEENLRRLKEREYWDKLKKLANEDKVKEFFTLYSEYLEFSKIYSPDRQAIYKMVKKASELL